MSDQPTGMRDNRVRVLGTLGSADGRGSLRIEDRFDTDIDDLWSAITDPQRLARWIGEFTGDFRVGGDFRARYYGSEWTGSGHVEACDPPRYFRVRTTEDATDMDDTEEDDTEVDAVTEVTLAADGEQTVLVLERRGMPLVQIAGYGAGTQLEVEQLRAFVTGSQPPDPAQLWPVLMPQYQAMAAQVHAVAGPPPD